MIRSTMNRGFSMTFENGMTISVQFGTGTYCERKDLLAPVGNELKEKVVESENAEIGIWDKNGDWFNFEHDKVKGWVPADEIAQWIHMVKCAINLDNLTELAVGYGMMEENA